MKQLLNDVSSHVVDTPSDNSPPKDAKRNHSKNAYASVKNFGLFCLFWVPSELELVDCSHLHENHASNKQSSWVHRIQHNMNKSVDSRPTKNELSECGERATSITTDLRFLSIRPSSYQISDHNFLASWKVISIFQTTEK